MVSEKTLNVKKEACTGCGACINICQNGAISMVVDGEGFWYPNVCEEKCLSCEQCVHVCPILREKKSGFTSRSEGQSKIYAAWSLDPEIRYQSTSGGIFSELALCVLSKEGCICGAVYDERYQVRHYVTDNQQELSQLRQSKYVQSDMGNIYREMGNLLNQGKSLLFCGSPCQCAGVFYYCSEKNIDMKNLYLVDFICRGSNSPKVYGKFLEELEKIYQSKIRKVWFKNKTYGWNRFSTKIEFENGSFYLKDRYHDAYIRGYIEENLYIRPSCMNCKFKGFHRLADITLADFWGVQLEEHREECDGGTSLVMVHTNKGDKLWNEIHTHVYHVEKTLKEAISENVCFEHSVRSGSHRKEFMEDLDRLPVIDNIERFLIRQENR